MEAKFFLKKKDEKEKKRGKERKREEGGKREQRIASYKRQQPQTQRSIGANGRNEKRGGGREVTHCKLETTTTTTTTITLTQHSIGANGKTKRKAHVMEELRGGGVERVGEEHNVSKV